MKFLRALLDKQAHHFEAGGKLERLYPLWEARTAFCIRLIRSPRVRRTCAMVLISSA